MKLSSNCSYSDCARMAHILCFWHVKDMNVNMTQYSTEYNQSQINGLNIISIFSCLMTYTIFYMKQTCKKHRAQIKQN